MSIVKVLRIIDVRIFWCVIYFWKNQFLITPVLSWWCWPYVWQLRTQPIHAAYDIINSNNEKPLFEVTYNTQLLQACAYAVSPDLLPDTELQFPVLHCADSTRVHQSGIWFFKYLSTFLNIFSCLVSQNALTQILHTQILHNKIIIYHTQTPNHDWNYTYGHILPTIRFYKKTYCCI